ncbi:MAG: hypothetical protein LBH73_07870 [Spirochaetaceae bacterium]|jgi:hypothetical protein|nr:hypothetical protein [Spirochaetaceae bacterium]
MKTDYISVKAGRKALCPSFFKSFGHSAFLSPARLSGALLLVFFFASCASGPKLSGPDALRERNVFSVLPGGAALYIYADVERAKPLLELMEFGGMSGASNEAILGRTSVAVAAIYPGESGRRYMAWGSGKYPSLRSSISFFFSRAWKKAKSETGNSYWRNQSAGLSVLIRKDYALVSDGDPFFTEAPLEPSSRWTSLEAGAVLSGTVRNAGERVGAFMGSLGLPIQFPVETLVFGLYPAPPDPAGNSGRNPPDESQNEARYQGRFYIETPAPSHARSVQSILSLARRYFPGGPTEDPFLAALGAFFANQSRLEGSTLIITTGPMTAGEITLLFDQFSVYSE